MKVEIEGVYYDYNSDFDSINIQDNIKRNWKVSAGDYFKFPIKIGFNYCFIKRFAKKKEDISGYDFLVKAKGKSLQGLPKIYDVVEITEKGNHAIYLFTEYIQGETIDALHRKGFTFLPIKLATDLFNALKSIHELRFWFPDFDPKNFLRSNTGNFYIIDLDSVYSIRNLPQSSMYGSKDYWSPVYNFYRIFFSFSTREVKLLRGDTLNIVQLIYFMSLYSFYLFGDGEDLTAVSLERLNEYLSANYKLFLSTMRYCFFKNEQSNNISQRTLNYSAFSSLINTCLFPSLGKTEFISNSSKKIQLYPTISFTIQNNKKNLISEDSYILQWSVLNATSVFLDNSSVNLYGTKNFIAKKNTIHTLTALNSNNLKAKEIKSNIEIIVDPKPEINLSVSKNKIKSGAKATVQWQVKNGKNITILQNGISIAKNCQPNGVLDVSPVINNNSNLQNFTYRLTTSTISGNHIQTSPTELIITVEKKNDYEGVYILMLIVAVIMFAVITSNNSSSSRYNTGYSTDSTTAMMADTSMMASDTSSMMMTDTSMMMSPDTSSMMMTDTSMMASPDTSSIMPANSTINYKDDNDLTPQDAVAVFLYDLNNKDCDAAWNITYSPTWENKGKEWFCSSNAFGGITKVQLLDSITSVSESENEAEIWVHYYAEDFYNGNKCFKQKIEVNKISFGNNQIRWMIVKLINLEEPFSCVLNN